MQYLKRPEFWTRGAGNKAQLIVKLTERCNLACRYCYFFFGGDESYKEHPGVMPIAVENALVAFAQRGASDLHLKELTLILHGGEPLLMKKARFDAFCQKFRTALPESTTLKISIQTNGVLVDDEWVRIFERHRVYVGFSLDGPADWNDEVRVDLRGRGTHARAVAGLRRIQDAAAENGLLVPPGALCVADPARSASALLAHFVDELRVKSVDFLLQDQTRDKLTEEVKALNRRFFLELLDEWLGRGDGSIRIRFFRRMLTALGQRAHGREGMSAYFRARDIVLTIASDGTVAPDDLLRSADGQLLKTNLNVLTHSLLDVVLHSAIRDPFQSAEQLPDDCKPCLFRHVCRGGELLHRYDARDQSFNHASGYCDTLYAVHRRLSRVIVQNGIIGLDDIAESVGAEPATLIEHIA